MKDKCIILLKINLLLFVVVFNITNSIYAQYDNTNILIEEAVNHIYQKRYEQAYNNLKQAYKQQPRNPSVHFNLGRLYEITGNYSEALKEYQITLTLDPTNLAAKRGIARCTVELKRNKISENINLEHSARLPSDKGFKFVNSGLSQNKPLVGGMQKAQIVTQDPNFYSTQSQNYVSAFKHDKSLKNNIGSSIQKLQYPSNLNNKYYSKNEIYKTENHLIQGTSDENEIEELIEKKEYSKAAKKIEALLSQDADNPKLLFLLGKLQIFRGELFNGIKHLEEALRINDKIYEAYYLLAQAYSRVNLLDDALKNYLLYYKIKPNASVAVEIARIYERIGDPIKAKEFYDKANAMNPGNPQLQIKLNDTNYNIARNLYLRANHAFSIEDYKSSIELFEQALSLGLLESNYQKDAERKLQIAKFKLASLERETKEIQQGYTQTRATLGTINLYYHQLFDIAFKTNFIGPVIAEWKAYVVRRFYHMGKEFALMIKVLSKDEEEKFGREQRDFKLNANFTNQPVFLLQAPPNGFPSFVREGTFITFTGKTEWRFYEIFNDLGQKVKLPSFEYISAYPS